MPSDAGAAAGLAPRALEQVLEREPAQVAVAGGAGRGQARGLALDRRPVLGLAGALAQEVPEGEAVVPERAVDLHQVQVDARALAAAQVQAPGVPAVPQSS